MICQGEGWKSGIASHDDFDFLSRACSRRILLGPTKRIRLKDNSNNAWKGARGFIAMNFGGGMDR